MRDEWLIQSFDVDINILIQRTLLTRSRSRSNQSLRTQEPTATDAAAQAVNKTFTVVIVTAGNNKHSLRTLIFYRTCIRIEREWLWLCLRVFKDKAGVDFVPDSGLEGGWKPLGVRSPKTRRAPSRLCRDARSMVIYDYGMKNY